MTKVAVVLSIAALGLAGYAAYETTRGAAQEHRERLERLEARTDELAVLATRLDNLEARFSSGSMAPRAVESAPLAATPRPAEGSPRAADGSPAKAGDAAGTAPDDISRRLAALEEKTKAIEAQTGGPGARLRLGKDGMMLPGLGNRRAYTSVEDAQTDLELSASQRADFDRAVADAKRELDELHKIPDDEGKTWDQTREEMMKGLVDGSGRFDLSKMMAFRGKTIPGRTETFGGAEARIRNDAKRKMRDSLSNDQQSKFDQALVEPMLGGMGGPVTSFSVFSADDASGMSSK